MRLVSLRVEGDGNAATPLQLRYARVVVRTKREEGRNEGKEKDDANDVCAKAPDCTSAHKSAQVLQN